MTTRTAFLSDMLQTIVERGRTIFRPTGGRETEESEGIESLCAALISSRGEASSMTLASRILDAWRAADRTKRGEIFAILAGFGPDHDRLKESARTYFADPADATAQMLHAAAEPARQELIRRLNLAPGAMAGLVEMRAELLSRTPLSPELASVDRDFVHLFSSWFNRGFLTLRRIDWTTPANILEKIIQYEAVHTIGDWSELRRRIEPPDRRCFAFFHPQLADEPLIFVEVALTTDIPAAIPPLLAKDQLPIAAGAANTAVFYSISNCQVGLRGISFGSFLVKCVVDELSKELPNLRHFVTLSPVAGFRAWLTEERSTNSAGLLGAADLEILSALDAADWHREEPTAKRLRALLLPIAAHYLLAVRTGAGRLRDPVERFHLGNGARIERLNFLGDPSPKGFAEAHGLMVNYRYDLTEIEANHEAFAHHGEIAAAPAVWKSMKMLAGHRLRQDDDRRSGRRSKAGMEHEQSSV